MLSLRRDTLLDDDIGIITVTVVVTLMVMAMNKIAMAIVLLRWW